MAKREYYVTLRCDHDGCRETTRYCYTTKRDHKKALERYKDYQYLCHTHSRVQVTDKNTSFSKVGEYKVIPHWMGTNGYKSRLQSDDGINNSKIYGDDWIVKVDDLPLGTRVVVETKVRLYIPDNPDPLPKWQPMLRGNAKGHKPVVITDYNDLLMDGDFIVMIKNGSLLVGKTMHESGYMSTLENQAYRPLLNEEAINIRSALSKGMRVGQRVFVSRWECDGYHCYNYKLVQYEATLLSIGDDFKSKVITVPTGNSSGKELTVYTGYISKPESECII